MEYYVTPLTKKQSKSIREVYEIIMILKSSKVYKATTTKKTLNYVVVFLFLSSNTDVLKTHNNMVYTIFH